MHILPANDIFSLVDGVTMQSMSQADTDHGILDAKNHKRVSEAYTRNSENRNTDLLELLFSAMLVFI